LTEKTQNGIKAFKHNYYLYKSVGELQLNKVKEPITDK